MFKLDRIWTLSISQMGTPVSILQIKELKTSWFRIVGNFLGGDNLSNCSKHKIWISKWVTSMLITEVSDSLCWWPVWDVGDKSRRQHQEQGTKIKFRSLTSHSGILWCWRPIGMSLTYLFRHQHLKICHQYWINNITLTNNIAVT